MHHNLDIHPIPADVPYVNELSLAGKVPYETKDTMEKSIVPQKVVAKTHGFQSDSPLGDDLFWIPGLIAANHSIGGINYACVQSRLLSSGVNVPLYRRCLNIFASGFASRKGASISLINAA